MKKIRITAVITALLLISLIFLGGCTAGTSGDISAAQKTALEDAGVTESEVTDLSATTSEEDGRQYYTITFSDGNSLYCYVINDNGEIIEKNIISTAGDTVVSESTTISENEALTAALKDAGVSASDMIIIKTEKGYEDGIATYEIDFYAGDNKYEYVISAATGEILERENEIAGELMDASDTADGVIDEDLEAAKETALADAGVKAEDAEFTKAEFDTDNGIPVYDIEFISNGKEYEYEINAETGEIIERSQEKADLKTSVKSKNATASSGSGITKTEAKAIALKHAGFSESGVTFTKTAYDTDDGVRIIEIEFTTPDGYEYEYEIKASDGSVISWDKDIND